MDWLIIKQEVGDLTCTYVEKRSFLSRPIQLGRRDFRKVWLDSEPVRPVELSTIHGETLLALNNLNYLTRLNRFNFCR